MTFHPSGGIAPAHPTAADAARLDAIRADLQALLHASPPIPGRLDRCRLEVARMRHDGRALAGAAAHGADLLAALGLPAIDGGAL